MVPDKAPEVGLQPDLQVPPHVRVAWLLSLYLPAGQLRQTLDAEAPVAVWNMPAPQSVQVLAPTVAEYVLALQPTHVPEATAGLYVPAAHAAQGPPAGPLCPTGHWQLPSAVLALGELSVLGQAVHSAEPIASLYGIFISQRAEVPRGDVSLP
jgi:hypothetical protein